MKAIAADNRDAVNGVHVRRLLRREIAPPYRKLYIEGAQGPTEAIRMWRFKTN